MSDINILILSFCQFGVWLVFRVSILSELEFPWTETGKTVHKQILEDTSETPILDIFWKLKWNVD